MRPARIIATVIFAAAIAITGCSAHSRAAPPSPPQTAPNPTHTTTPVDRQAPIYAAVLRQYLTSGDAAIAADHRFPQIFVIDHAVAAPAPQATAPLGADRSHLPPAVPSPTPSPMLAR
jgi:hypothetical protein